MPGQRAGLLFAGCIEAHPPQRPAPVSWRGEHTICFENMEIEPSLLQNRH
jgi:hypothetical protein